MSQESENDANSSVIENENLTKAVDEKRSKLAFALSRAQAEITPPVKNRKVDFTDKNGRRVKYSYADLADVIEAMRLPLTKNELTVFHQLEIRLTYGLSTTLMHSSGESISTWYPLPDPGNVKPQEFGSSLTYARRYSISSLIGIASEEDDDGANAEPPEKPGSGSKPPQKKDPPKPSPAAQKKPGTVTELKNHAPKPPTRAQIKRMYAIAGQNAWPSESVRVYCVKKVGRTPGNLSQDQYQKLCEYLEGAPYDDVMADQIRVMVAGLNDKEKDLLEHKNDSLDFIEAEEFRDEMEGAEPPIGWSSSDGEAYPPPPEEIPQHPAYLDQLYQVVAYRKIPSADMKKYIKLCTGTEKLSKDLTEDECALVIKHINTVRPSNKK